MFLTSCRSNRASLSIFASFGEEKKEEKNKHILTSEVVTRKKIVHYRQLYIDRPEPIAFMPVEVDTPGRIYDDFLRLLFLHSHRETSALGNDIPGVIPEESGHFRFLHVVCLDNIKGSVGLILTKSSVIRISIPLDLSSRPFIPPPCFIHSRRPTTLLTPSLVFSPLRSA